MASTSKQNQATSLGKGNKSSSERSPKSPKNNPKSSQSSGSMGLGLILIAISTSLIGLGGLGYFIYQELLASSQRELESSAVSKSSQIESKVAIAKKSVDSVASKAAAFPKQRNAVMYQKLLVEALQNSEPIAAMGISASGNALIPSAKSFTTYVLRDKSGLSPEPNGQKLAAPNDNLRSATLADVQKLPWYKSALEGNSSWTSPYSFFGQNIVTYSSAIRENNKSAGVVSGDIVVSSLLPASTEDKMGFVVVGADGKLIASSDSFQTAQAQNPAIAESLNSLIQQSTNQPSGIIQTAGNLWAYRQIEGSKWLVATYVPETVIMSKLAIPVGAAAIAISSILVIAILAFTSSLKKRLQPITEECERFLAQQGNSPIASGKDDIENLSLSLKTTLQQVKTNEIRLRNELTQVSATTDASSVQTQQQIRQSFAENELIEAEVGDLLDVVSSMEEGDLTIEAQVNDRATGLVADTLNRLREKLVEIISSVLGTAQQVAKGASDLEELTRTVVLNTAEQAQSVAQGQALTEQVAMIAQRSASQASVANRSLQEVRETVASGQTAIDTLTDSISVLQSGSAQIVQRIKTLGEFVGLAEQFVQDQGQIASLTQVLALNATLVAARAAEQKDPKQFASVAREFESIAGQVNELATQTNDGLTVLQQRTSQIQTVVTAIDSEVQSLSGLVSGFTTGVESSQAAFHNIQTVTEDVVQIGQTITESSTEIAEAAGSTATYISEIAQLAERTASLTRSARQQAEEMGNQAQQLLQGIQFFRLPENSHPFSSPSSNTFIASANTNLATEKQVAQPEAIAQPLDDQSNLASGSEYDNNLGLIIVPTLAVATATALNASQQDQDDIPTTLQSDFEITEQSPDVNVQTNGLSDLPDESLAADITEDFATNGEISDSDLDDYDDYLLEPDYESFEDSSEVPLESSIDYGYNLNTDLASQDDQMLSFMDDLESLDEPDEESGQLYIFDDQEEIQEIDVEQTSQSSDTYSGITDITMIEESLLADLRQEIYQDSSDENANDYSEALDVFEDDNMSLKNPLDGVDETAISDASTDPMILSATTSFLEDTTFGTPSDLSDETLAHLPTYVDFNIPDLDSDSDFEIPSNLIESTLDDSNSFFDASFAASSEQVEQVNTESAFGDPYAEQDSLDSDRYLIDEEMFTTSSSDTDLDVSIDDQLISSESEDYNNYVNDEAFNESLHDAFGVTSDEVFNDSFGSSFDESPFDRAFDEAINDYPNDPFSVVTASISTELSEDIVEESSDDFTFEQSFPIQGDDDLSEIFSDEIGESTLADPTELNSSEDTVLGIAEESSTAFPPLFDGNILSDDFEPDFRMSFQDNPSEEVEDANEDLDSIWQLEDVSSDLSEVAQEQSPIDDLALSEFSTTDNDESLVDIPEVSEAIALEDEDVLTDEMFSFDLNEEVNDLSDSSVFEMDLHDQSEDSEDDAEQNVPPYLFDDELSNSLDLEPEIATQIVEDSFNFSDVEESAIFGIAPDALRPDPEVSPDNIADELSRFYEVDAGEELESEDMISSESDLEINDLSVNWLNATIEDGEADEVFDDFLIEYPSLDQPEIGTSMDYNSGFADDLLDSLMSEADQSDFLVDMSDSLPDLSDIPTNTSYADPFANPVESVGSDGEDIDFEFDFSAFDNIDANNIQDESSKEVVDARSEIDSFLSETFGIDEAVSNLELEEEAKTIEKKKKLDS